MSHTQKKDQMAVFYKKKKKNCLDSHYWLCRSEENLIGSHDPPGQVLKETEVIDARQCPLCFAQ